MPLSLYCIPVLYAEDSKFPNHFAIPQYERLNFQTAYLNFFFFSMRCMDLSTSY